MYKGEMCFFLSGTFNLHNKNTKQTIYVNDHANVHVLEEIILYTIFI